MLGAWCSVESKTQNGRRGVPQNLPLPAFCVTLAFWIRGDIPGKVNAGAFCFVLLHFILFPYSFAWVSGAPLWTGFFFWSEHGLRNQHSRGLLSLFNRANRMCIPNYRAKKKKKENYKRRLSSAVKNSETTPKKKKTLCRNILLKTPIFTVTTFIPGTRPACTNNIDCRRLYCDCIPISVA